MFPVNPPALLSALTIETCTSSGACRVMLPPSDWTVAPLVIRMSPLLFPSRSVALLKSEPALSTTIPTPAAPMVIAASEIVSPANRLMFPSPPSAVTASLIVKSSAVSEPSAARVMLPPALLMTGASAATVSGLAARTVMSPPPLVFPPSVMVTPASVSTVPIVSPPVF